MNLPLFTARFGLVLLAIGWPGASLAQPYAADEAVETSSGSVEGVATESGRVFRGLPYAAPPIGPLRWRSPQPPQAWSGTRLADTFAPPCAQPALRGRTAVSDISSEDCLYLNVWTPLVPSESDLPVMVWIHGGAFQNGMGSSPTYDGSNLSRRGVIVVTLNYRLGVFGFLAHPELTAQDEHRSSGNFGLQDQIAALRWVAENIRSFGGDPSNVTLFGQSAGGASVLNVISSREAEGLFRRAIIQSGAARSQIVATPLDIAEGQGRALAGDATIAELRALDTAGILQHTGAAANLGVRFGPVEDGYVIEVDAAAVLAERQRNGLQLLIGSNAREGLSVLPDDSLEAAIVAEFGANAARALAVYRPQRDGGADDPLLGTPAQQFSTDTTFRCGNVEVAQASAAAGLATWQYQFEHFVPGREDQGAGHSFEVPYVFGNLSRTGFSAAEYGPADSELSALMVGYWTNFARHGDPNGSGLPIWPQFSPADEAYLRLSGALPDGAAPANHLRAEICSLLPSPTTTGTEY